MKKIVKQWLGIKDKVQEVKDAPYFLVNRHYLSSVKPGDADEYLTKLTNAERRQYEVDASLVYNNLVFQKEVKHLLALQVQFVANESSNWEQVLIGRGTVNGIGLIEDRFQLLNSRHFENIKRPEEDI